MSFFWPTGIIVSEKKEFAATLSDFCHSQVSAHQVFSVV